MSEKPYKHALGTIELLHSTNYANWKRSCRRILEGIRAWAIVMGEELEPINPAGFAAAAVAERAVYIDFMNRRAQAAAIISGSCSNMVQVYLERSVTLRKCGLSSLHEWTRPARLLDGWRSFESFTVYAPLLENQSTAISHSSSKSRTNLSDPPKRYRMPRS